MIEGSEISVSQQERMGWQLTGPPIEEEMLVCKDRPSSGQGVDM